MRRSRSARKRIKPTQIQQATYQQKCNPYPPFEIFSIDEIEAIHQASLKILRDIGMDFQSPLAVDILRKAGANIADNNVRVRFDSDFIMKKIATAPSHFTLHGRIPQYDLTIGKNFIAFGMVASTPNVSDLKNGRRQGTFVDYGNLLRLAQSLNAVNMITGYPVEPCDLDVRIRHLLSMQMMVKLTSKPYAGYAIGRERMADNIEIARIARGINHQQLQSQPSIHAVVNSNSPLIYDRNLLEGAIVMAENNQPVIYTPFTLAGAMAPITLAGALVQQNAEALAGIAFSQCVRAGAPVIYGSFTSNVDMRTGSPAFGTPEYTQATIASGQLARRYHLPLRASNANTSNASDAQATYESQMSLWGCVLGHINYVHHGVGWLEGGLCTSFEKMIIDAEMIQMMNAFLQMPTTTIDDLAVNAIAEVGPGNHFFQSPHTIQRYKSAFYSPMLSDWRNFENWCDNDAQDTTMRAHKIWQQLLQDYEEPKLDPAIAEELDEFVAKRIEEGGVSPL